MSVPSHLSGPEGNKFLTHLSTVDVHKRRRRAKGADLLFCYFPNCPLLALTSTVPFLVSTSPTIKAKVCISVVIRQITFSLELNVTFLATLVSEFTYKS